MIRKLWARATRSATVTADEATLAAGSPVAQTATREELDAAALVVARTVTRLHGLEDEVAELRRRFEPRDDLPGLRLFVRVLELLVESAKDKLMRLAGEEAAAEGEEGQEYGLDVNAAIAPALSEMTSGLANLELALDAWKDLFSEPQGRKLDAIATGYRELVRALPGKGELELIFKPVPVMAYKVHMNVLRRFRNLRLGLDRTLFTTMPSLMMVEYPALFEGDAFQHAAIAHEVAHVALQDHEDTRTQGPEGTTLRETGSEPQAVWDWALWTSGVDKDAAIDRRDTFVELACDFLAVRLVGPAYALAFAEFTLAQNILRTSSKARTHPPLPWRIARLRAAVEPYLRDGEPGTALEDGRLAMEELMAVFGPREEPDDKLVITALDRLEHQLVEVIGEAAFPVERFRQELQIVSDKMAFRIAPAEAIYERDIDRPAGEAGWSVPLDWRSILNGGYLRYLHESPTTSVARHWAEAADRDAERATMCEFIRGSIELRHLHAGLRDMRTQLQGIEIPVDA